MRSTRNRRRSSHTENLLWGVKNAFILTGICFVPAAIVFVAMWTRSDSLPDAPKGATWPWLIGTYSSIALVGGIVVGVFRNRLRTAAGSVWVGMLVGIAGFLILLWKAGEPTDASSIRALGALLGAVAGALLGYTTYRTFKRYERLSNEELKPTATPSSLVE